jgi:hypothetical protein
MARYREKFSFNNTLFNSFLASPFFLLSLLFLIYSLILFFIPSIPHIYIYSISFSSAADTIAAVPDSLICEGQQGGEAASTALQLYEAA